MAYKLLDAAQDRWRRINGHELVPLVRAGATFIDGKLQERSVTDDRQRQQHRVRRRLIEKPHPQLLTMTRLWAVIVGAIKAPTAREQVRFSLTW